MPQKYQTIAKNTSLYIEAGVALNKISTDVLVFQELIGIT